MDTALLLIKSYFLISGKGTFEPVVTKSVNFVKWLVNLSVTTCLECREKMDRIYDVKSLRIRPPLHVNCRCRLVPLSAIAAGTATIDGIEGADYYMKEYGALPDNYITKKEAEKIGWINYKGNLREMTIDATIGGDGYRNEDRRLPLAPGRKWYEADINYTGGYRNKQRLMYSNDGLIFVTYDHYETFYEIV